MITRRFLCGCLAGALPFAKTVVQAQSLECAVFTPDRQKATAPDEAITRLKVGNERFTAGKSINCDLMAQVRETANNQSPFAAIVGCIDSRVPPELVFDQRIGDVFCARVAGNFVNTDIVAASNIQPRSPVPRRSSSWDIIFAARSRAPSMMSSSAILRRCSRTFSQRSRRWTMAMATGILITTGWFKRSPRRTPA
jgi:hypothetical protein